MVKNPLCQYKDIFGAPNTGVHAKYRLFDIAMVDVFATVIVVFLVWMFSGIPLQHLIVYAILAMIIGHRLFCVRSTTDKWLFP